MRFPALLRAGLLSAGALLLALGPGPSRGQTRTPPLASADSTPPESPPGPLLIPGRPSPADSTRRTAAQRARDAYELGRRLEDMGRYGPAIVSYRNALRIDPKLPDANYRMAMLYLTRDRADQAVKCLLLELKHHPENLDADRELGLCIARFGDYPKAIAHLEGLTGKHPKDGSIWHALGSVYLAAGRPADAESALEKALHLGPESAEVLRDLGATMSARGRDAEARVYYRRAVSLDPGDAASWLNLGNLERRASRPDSALMLYRRAEAADSSFVPALEAQIQMLSDGRHDADILAIHLRRLRQHPNHHGSRLEAIRILEAQEREAEALALARDGTQKVPTDGQTFLILGMVLRSQGDTHASMTALYRAQTLFVNNPKERERVTQTIEAIKASSPDSVRAGFRADSIASFPRRPR